MNIPLKLTTIFIILLVASFLSGKLSALEVKNRTLELDTEYEKFINLYKTSLDSFADLYLDKVFPFKSPFEIG